jgi:hypothetical protein
MASTAQIPPVIASITLYESRVQASGEAIVATAPFACYGIPATANPQFKDGRLIYRAPVPFAPIPATGQIIIARPNKDDQITNYNITIPTVVRKDGRKDSAPGQQILAKHVRLLGDKYKIISDTFAGWDELPDVHWVQLNNATRDLAVQMKLEKTIPVDLHKSKPDGVYCVYAVTLVALNVRLSEAELVEQAAAAAAALEVANAAAAARVAELERKTALKTSNPNAASILSI